MGYKIREERERIGMTQTELSERSGVSRGTISALENGTLRATTTKTLIRIAKAMGTTVDCIFFDEDAQLIKQKGNI